MNKLQCVEQINGFTVGKSYEIVEDNSNTVKVFDNNLVLRRFEKVEGVSDFKNWFIGQK